MGNLWERFENIATPEEVESAKAEFTPMAEGMYKVRLEEIEAGEIKSGLPMLKGKFRVIESNRVIFYNQVLQNLSYPFITAKNIASATIFINGLTHEELEFTGIGALAERVAGITMGGEYDIQLTYEEKDVDKKFPKIEIIQVVTGGEEFMTVPDGIEELPFK